MEEELKNWDAIQATGAEQQTVSFLIFNMIRDYLPNKLPPNVDAKRYSEMLVSNEGNARDTFFQAFDNGLFHHGMSRLIAPKSRKICEFYPRETLTVESFSGCCWLKIANRK